MIHTMKTIKLLILLLSFAVGLSSLTSCSDDGPEPTPIAEAPVFAMDENFEITARCANPYKAYVNGIETILPYTITQTYKQQTIVVSGYGYGVNLQNSDTVEQTFVVPALEDTHEYVDLGLPSGTLWATCNIGASAPEEYGDYFAWGETEPKETYTRENYKWCQGSFDTMTKYCTDSGYGSNGFTDGKTELDPEDDAAYVNWGPSWRMPTHEQQRELVEQCTWIGHTLVGVKGQLVTGPNGNTIFLPASRSSVQESPWDTGTWGTWAFYWSRTLRTNQSDNASDLLYPAYPANATWDHYNDRYIGEAVRPVRLP